MSLSELIAGVEDHEKTLTVFNADSDVAAEFRERFADRNVTVRRETTPSGKPGQFVTLSEAEEVLTATSITDLQRMLDGTDGALGLSDSPYQPILDHMDETMFTSWSIEQMVAASREIEDRAWRVGDGTLHAGFQYLSTLRGELPVYERLASKNLDVHTYATPDEEPPEHEGFTLHIERANEIERCWFVVFDGGASATPTETGEPGDQNGEAGNKCALLAEERDPRKFYGFWTYDPDTVDWIVDHLESAYGVVEQ
ncbi:histidine kinase [Halorientalis sp. IM1011]|uniref:DICT sensory domain-containing protein n=1 Tax=Halorientalis sp. IM1011 TaxID=1932360 RepID=UPI00097CC42F|nr:DICT sensory domain-containing protein [Halorientalis sp. IM1011]AQL41601.1 histidine kinase [Halorientalis sp. IM1011]